MWVEFVEQRVLYMYLTFLNVLAPSSQITPQLSCFTSWLAVGPCYDGPHPPLMQYFLILEPTEQTKNPALPYNDDSTHLSGLQARTLMVLAHAFYTDPMNYQHVHNFNHDPDRFDYKEILQQLGHDLPPL